MDLVLTDAQVADIRTGQNETGGIQLTLTDEQVSLVGARPKIRLHKFVVPSSFICTKIYEYDAVMQYERFDNAFLVLADTFSTQIHKVALGGSKYIIGTPQVGVVVAKWDDFDAMEYAAPTIEIGRFNATGSTAAITFSSNSLSSCGLIPGEDYVMWYVGYDANGNLQAMFDSFLPSQFHYNPENNPSLQKYCLFDNTSYEWSQAREPYVLVRVPLSFCKPQWRTIPRRPRLAPLAGSWLGAANTYVSQRTPMHGHGFFCPTVTRDGYVVHAGKHGYFENRMNTHAYEAPLRDGPRGVGMGGYMMGVRTGRHQAIFGEDGCGTAFVRYLSDGTRLTIMGSVDDPTKLSPYYLHVAGHPNRTQRGDWSRIPDLYGRRRMNNAWDWCWDFISIMQGAATNAVVDGEVVHDSWVISNHVDRCAEGGRILACFERGDDPNRGKLDANNNPLWDPAIVVEALPPTSEFKDAWGLEWWVSRGAMLMADRKNHGLRWVHVENRPSKGEDPSGYKLRLGEWFYQFPNGSQYVGFADDGLPASQWDIPYLRQFVRKASLATLQALPGPIAIESIRILNGGISGTGPDEIYVASGAQQLIWRTTDGITWEKVGTFVPGSNKYVFLRIDVSDGAFLTRGTVAAVSFDNATGGTRAVLYNPVPTAPYTHTKLGDPIPGSYTRPSGRASAGIQRTIYPVDVAFSRKSQEWGGLITTDTAQGGPIEWTKVQADDPPAPNATRMTTGQNDYKKSGAIVILGENGYPMIDADLTDLDPPVTADTQYWWDEVRKAQ